MSLLTVASVLYIFLWLFLLITYKFQKKWVHYCIYALWIPIGVQLLYYCNLFLQTNIFPATNFEQFSIFLMFLIFICLNIVYLKSRELVVYCHLWYIPLFIFISYQLTQNSIGTTVFNQYSQIILFLHIGLVAVGQMFFTFSFIGAIFYLGRKVYVSNQVVFKIIVFLLFSSAILGSYTLGKIEILIFLFFLFLLFLLLPFPKNYKEEKVFAYTKYFVIIGLFFFSIGGLIFGMVWANIAWGRFWSWDPKETWALLSFFIYSLYLHWNPKNNRELKNALFLIIAFLFLMFNFIYINFFIEGLHSYAY